MKCKFIVLCLFFILSGCSSSLINDTYKYTQNGTEKEMYTAFIILSNMGLNNVDIERVKADYENESNSTRKFLYEYLLAKRTQEERYILSFIESSKNNYSILLNTDSYWISLGSPILELLSIYSKTNDEALAILLTLVVGSDGVIQSIIASNLLDVYEVEPTRFVAIANKMELDINSILLLMEDE
jgi:hypothetical protein